MRQYDVAAYIWPADTGEDPRARLFWKEGIGEWQSVKNSVRKTPDYNWNRKPLWGYILPPCRLFRNFWFRMPLLKGTGSPPSGLRERICPARSTPGSGKIEKKHKKTGKAIDNRCTLWYTENRVNDNFF